MASPRLPIDGLTHQQVIDLLGPPVMVGDGISVEKGALVYDKYAYNTETRGQLTIWFRNDPDSVVLWYPSDTTLDEVKRTEPAAGYVLIDRYQKWLPTSAAARNLVAQSGSEYGVKLYDFLMKAVKQLETIRGLKIEVTDTAPKNGIDVTAELLVQVGHMFDQVYGKPMSSPTSPRNGPAAATSGSLPALATCGLSPSYASSIGLSRWRGTERDLTIPVKVVGDSRLPGLSSRAAQLYEEATVAGLALWQVALDTRPNSPRIRLLTSDSASASIQIGVIDQIPAGMKPSLLGVAESQLEGGVIVRSRISVFRQNLTKQAEAKLAAGGLEAELAFKFLVTRVVAHEIGHALGLGTMATDSLSHPTGLGYMMTDHYEGFDPDITRWITDADVNTLAQAYCIPGTAPKPISPPANVVSDNPVAPFTGSWSCSVPPVGVDYFTIRADGAVTFAADDQVGRAVVSGNTIRFDQSGDRYFYDKRAFQFSIQNGQLRGTRTETSSNRATTVDQYTCRRS
jgi:hypothetical protein